MNYDRLGLGQMRVETRDSRALGKFLKNKEGGVMEFVLGEEERNEIKTKIFTN